LLNEDGALVVEILADMEQVLVFVFGFLLVVFILMSAIRTFVLPRSENVFLTRLIFQLIFILFQFRLHWANSYKIQDRVMAFYAPITLLVMPVVWITGVMMGYMLMFWGLGVQPLYNAFLLSGSSLLTLGFAPAENTMQMVLIFTEATIGLGLIALLIAYLPTMYTSFSKREAMVTMLEVRAGSPPSAVTMIERFNRIHNLEYLRDLWVAWEVWFTELEESHTTFIPLVFFRSPRSDLSWITAAGTVLDTAALVASTLDIPREPRADLCIRAGYLALRSIADSFEVAYNPNPSPDEPISITQQEFDEVYDRLAGQGIPVKPDRAQAWRDFGGWRVNYDAALLSLASLVMAPYAPWSSDRGPLFRPRLFRKRSK
jgi:hypothetical protein